MERRNVWRQHRGCAGDRGAARCLFLILAGSFSMARADTGSRRARIPSSLMADCSDSICVASAPVASR